MREFFKKIFKDERGSVIAPEMLIIIVGVVIVSGIIIQTLSSPLRSLHEVNTKNITKVSRGF